MKSNHSIFLFFLSILAGNTLQADDPSTAPADNSTHANPVETPTPVSKELKPPIWLAETVRRIFEEGQNDTKSYDKIREFLKQHEVNPNTMDKKMFTQIELDELTNLVNIQMSSTLSNAEAELKRKSDELQNTMHEKEKIEKALENLQEMMDGFVQNADEFEKELETLEKQNEILEYSLKEKMQELETTMQNAKNQKTQDDKEIELYKNTIEKLKNEIKQLQMEIQSQKADNEEKIKMNESKKVEAEHQASALQEEMDKNQKKLDTLTNELTITVSNKEKLLNDYTKLGQESVKEMVDNKLKLEALLQQSLPSRTSSSAQVVNKSETLRQTAQEALERSKNKLKSLKERQKKSFNINSEESTNIISQNLSERSNTGQAVDDHISCETLKAKVQTLQKEIDMLHVNLENCPKE